MSSNKPPILVLKEQVKELRKDVTSLKEDISFIKNLLIEKKKDTIVVDKDDNGCDTKETATSSGWFWSHYSFYPDIH